MGKEPNTVTPGKTPLVTHSTPFEDPASYWRSRPKAALRRIPTPVWRDRGAVNLPLLGTPTSVDMPGLLDFPGAGPDGSMDTFAFATRPGSSVEYVGVASAQGTVPDAFLIYFRHTVKQEDFQGDHKLLETGIGDYFTGRMQLCRQVLRSQRKVAVILPVSMGGAGEFASNVRFVEQCLQDITQELFPSLTSPPSLLLACNSDGIIPLNDFLTNCKGLVPRVKAVYDFDGSLVTRASGISLAGIGNAKVFRYRQSSTNAVAGARQVALPYDRWSRHFNFVPDWKEKLATLKATDPARALIAKQVQGFLHHFIPTCMLHHGLAGTEL